MELNINLSSISFFIIAISLSYLTYKIVEFLGTVKSNINNIETSVVSALKNVENLSQKLEPVIISLELVEKNINDTLINLQSRAEKIDPLIMELTDTSKTYNNLGKNINNNLNTQLPQILNNAQNITKDINDLSIFIKGKIHETDEIFENAHKRALKIIKLSDTILISLQELTIQLSSAITGLKGSLEYLTETLFNKRQGGK